MPAPDAVIDATGKYVMPGLVNTHMHWHEERSRAFLSGFSTSAQLYLATGTTTAREVGGNVEKTNAWRDGGSRHVESAAPDRHLPDAWRRGPAGSRVRPVAHGIVAVVREAKQRGSDG